MESILSNMAVNLREVRESDLSAFYEHQDDAIANQMAGFPAREGGAFMIHWHKILSDDSIIAKTILFGDQVAGNIVSYPLSGEREIGYWLGRAFWNKGIATQALALFLNIEMHRPIFAHAAIQNIASQRVLQKNGFWLTGHSSYTNGAGILVEEVILVLDEVK